MTQPTIIECQQYAPEWWAARRGVPTASEFHRFAPVWPVRMTAKGEPHKGDLRDKADAMLNYAAQLVGDLYDPMYGQREDYESAAMKNGGLMEPRVRAYYELVTGEAVRQVGFVRSACGRWGCSPDGLVGEDGGLECKSPECPEQVRVLLAGCLPAKHRAQVHGCLIVTGRKWWDYVSHADGMAAILRVRVEPDEYTDRLRETLDAFAAIHADVRSRIAAMVAEAGGVGAATVESVARASDAAELERIEATMF